MSFRQVYEKHVKRWTAHIALVMFLLAVAIHVAHLLGVLHWVPEGVLLETLGFASLFLITLLLESLITTDEKLDVLTRQSKKQSDMINQRVHDLSIPIH
jgi:hypothetical protein